MSELINLNQIRDIAIELHYQTKNSMAKTEYLKIIGQVDKRIEQIKKDRGIEKE